MLKIFRKICSELTESASIRRHVGLCAAIAGAIACGTAIGHAAPPAPSAVIPLARYLGTLWTLQAQINGVDATFLFDSAGGVTSLSPETAQRIGCKPWGQLTGFRMRGDKLVLPRCDHIDLGADGLTLHLPTVGVFDFAKLTPKDAPPLAGSIALDAFANDLITIDLKGRRLIIETPESLADRVSSAIETPLQLFRDVEGFSLTPLVAIDTTAGRIWMELDSGSDGRLVVGRHVAALLGMNPEVKGGQDIDAVLVGGVRLRTRGHVDDLILDGNIGEPTLENWVVTLDLRHGRAWIKQNG